MSVSTVSSLPASPEPFMSSSQRQGSRSGPSVRAAWVWENRKASSRWYWVALVVLCTLGMASGSSQYVSYRDVFDAQGASWLAVWGQATLLPSMMFIPLLVGALIAQIAAGEHAGRNWQRMNANRLQDAMILGKILHMAQVALLSALVLLVEFVITGLLLGFDPAGLGPYAGRIVPVAVSILAAELFFAWLGVIMTSFSSVMATVLVVVVAGSAITVMAPRAGALLPSSFITAACASRDPGSIDSMSSMIFVTLLGILWALVWALALRRAVNRAS